MRILTILMFVFSSLAYSVCMTEIDADAYGCFPLHEDAKAMKWCSDKHGSKYKAYITDNTCSKELAALLRGESYDSSQDNRVVAAACMTYEQGMDNGCQYYDYVAAQRYCAENYGNRYIPFVPDEGKCSLSRASGLRGELSGRYLIEGLGSRMDEVETIMTMIDREGLNPLGGLESKRPKIGNEFYTDTVQALMAKMNTLKKVIYENGQRNVPIKDERTAEYLKYSFRYLNVLARLYRVYAYVAHENHVALKTYTFKNLEYLNLKLKKEHALEILARANFRAKTIEDGQAIEFLIGQQDRQTYELLAINDPYTKKDYAKLVTYLGVRENLTNLWAVQRMSPDHIANARTNSCGNFLSFRPGRGGEMEESAAYKELFEYDVFYSDYVPRWESLVKASQGPSLLDERKATDLGEAIFKRVPELKDLVLNQMGGSVGLREQAAKDAQMLIEAENMTWEQFSYGHFSTIVMPGDDVLHRDAVIERIAQEAYYKRLEGVVDIFIASYLWVSDAAIKRIEREIRDFADSYLKAPFFASMKSALRSEMGDYNSASRLARQNRETKEEQTYDIAKKAIVAVNVIDAIENKTFDFRKMTTLEPQSIEELFMLFQDRVERDYKDLRQTLKHNEKLSGILNQMFKEISEEFKARFMGEGGGLKGSSGDRSKGLREIAYEIAKKYHKKYPFEISRYRMREMMPTVAVDNTRVATNRRYIPVLKDNTPVGMSKKEMLNNIPDIKEFERENYVAKADNTRVANPRLFLGATEPVKNSNGRNNPDRVTTGELGKPLEVSSPGKIKTNLGETDINNSKLVELFKNYGLLTGKAKTSKSTSVESELELPVWDNDQVITEPGFFIFRALEALNLDRVGMNKSSYGRFAGDIDAQKLLANNRVSNAYQSAPLLRVEHNVVKSKTKYCYTKTGTAYKCDEKKTVRVPLLKRIALETYTRSTNRFSSKSAKSLISDTVDMAIENTDDKLSKFCDVNYLNYKNDQDFKETFRASKYLRATITASVGKKEETVKRLSKLDAEIKKEIRSRWQVLEEDYLMPALDITMYISLAALAVVLVVGSGGAALPGVFAGVYGLASTILAWDLVIGVSIGVGNAVARYNTHFIETPAQLRFQQSIATSQVDFSKTVDWGMLADDRKMLKSKQVESAIFAAMDIGFSFMLVNQIRVGSGMVGKKAFQRLTGTKLRGWSAKPASMLKNPRFSQLRKEMGFFKAVKSKGTYIGKKIVSYMPKYQAIPDRMIKSGALRMGMVRKAKQLNIGNSPWAIIEDLKGHTAKLGERLSDYKKFVQADQKIVESVRLNRALKPKEILAHFDKTAVSFIPKALWKRVKSGNAKEVWDFFVKYDDVWEELKRAQGAVVNQRVKNIDAVAKKLDDFQAGVGAGHYRNGDYMQKFINTLTDNEIMALEEVAKKSKGIFSNFKSVFKDHARVVRGLKPVSYLAGYKGQNFTQNAYPESYFLDGELDMNYAVKSDAEDLINFYESMMNSSAANGEAVKQTREAAEEALARKIRNENGNISDY